MQITINNILKNNISVNDLENRMFVCKMKKIH